MSEIFDVKRFKMKQFTIIVCYCIFAFSNAFAQSSDKSDKIEKHIKALQKFKVSGYIQSQLQTGQQDASLLVGTPNENSDKSFNRIGIRRGRIKFTYTEGIASGVFQLDLTEKGIGFKDVYINVMDPFVKSSSLRAGIFDRPFGYEIRYSSSMRETPERSNVFNTLFPGERDLGAMITLRAAPSSKWSFIEMNTGLFSGNGIRQDTDSRKDFIGHIKAEKDIHPNINIGVGASYYNGSIYQGTENVYTMQDGSFVLSSDQDNIGKYAKREYVGFNAQFIANSNIGKTKIVGEYLYGTQPGLKNSSKSPNSSTQIIADTYIRSFNGWYVLLSQDLGNLPISALLKYDLYNPNRNVSNNNLGDATGTGSADVAYNTLGLGLVWWANKSLRVQAYYEIVKNETSVNLEGYAHDRKDDVFTLRLSYKF